MDFKVAGTGSSSPRSSSTPSSTASPPTVLAGALTQAREARLHILDVMGEAIDAPTR
jgi:polyribonucleotide nucleotidyltransferase